MNEDFKTWLVMSGIMMSVITFLCLTLKIKEFFELRKFKKQYNIALSNGTFKKIYPNMCGIWRIDKKSYFIFKEKQMKLDAELERKLIQDIQRPEPKEEI